MLIENGAHRYSVGAQVADSGQYRLYLCEQGGSNRQCLLQIATEVRHNAALQRAAFFLGELQLRSDEVEAEYAKVKEDPDHFLNYNLGFPELVDEFTCQEQGGRRINILAFRGIADISRMVPIKSITTKDKRRVDLRTSTWIMGKCLKLLAFFHDANISVGLTSGNSILIQPDEHYVVFLDWCQARAYDALPRDVRAQDIAQTAKAVTTLLGGDLETRTLPGLSEEQQPYGDMLFSLANGDQFSAKSAHQRFYELIDRLWKREFYPFTTLPL